MMTLILNKKILNKLSKDLQVMMKKFRKKNLKNLNEKKFHKKLID